MGRIPSPPARPRQGRTAPVGRTQGSGLWRGHTGGTPGNLHRRLLPGLSAAVLARPALAQAPWPNGPIRLIDPFPPGGSVDTISRLLQPHLAAELGVPVVIENRPGASGSIGTAALARSPADGNTWAMVFDTHAVNPSLISTLGFGTRRDLIVVMLVGTSPMLITTHNSRPWRNLQGLIAAAKAAGHPDLRLDRKRLARPPDHVAHAPAGRFPGAPRALLRRQRPSAQTGGRRSPLFPDLPTVAESGIPGIDPLPGGR